LPKISPRCIPRSWKNWEKWPKMAGEKLVLAQGQFTR
jgi:hypothetical protein